MLEKFFRFSPLRFTGASGEDEYDFLIFCEDGLCGLGLMEARVVDYTIF